MYMINVYNLWMLFMSFEQFYTNIQIRQLHLIINVF